MTEDDPGPRREAVRVLPVDPSGAVLLLRCRHPDTGRRFVITVGGGIDAGETAPRAAVRELWEETGIVARPEDLRGPFFEADVSFAWEGVTWRQHQLYYWLPVSHRTVSFEHQTAVEVATTVGHGWWPAAGLGDCPDDVLPDVGDALHALHPLSERRRP